MFQQPLKFDDEKFSSKISGYFRWSLPPILGNQPNFVGTDFTSDNTPMHKTLILTHQQPTQVTHV